MRATDDTAIRDLIHGDLCSLAVEPLYRLRPTPLGRRIWRTIKGEHWNVTRFENLSFGEAMDLYSVLPADFLFAEGVWTSTPRSPTTLPI